MCIICWFIFLSFITVCFYVCFYAYSCFCLLTNIHAHKLTANQPHNNRLYVLGTPETSLRGRRTRTARRVRRSKLLDVVPLANIVINLSHHQHHHHDHHQGNKLIGRPFTKFLQGLIGAVQKYRPNNKRSNG